MCVICACDCDYGLQGGTCKVLCCDLPSALQVIDPHTHEYMDRLRDEPVFLALSQKVHDYFARISDTRNQSKVALRLIEHFYYKTGGLRAGLVVDTCDAGGSLTRQQLLLDMRYQCTPGGVRRIVGEPCNRIFCCHKASSGCGCFLHLKSSTAKGSLCSWH